MDSTKGSLVCRSHPPRSGEERFPIWLATATRAALTTIAAALAAGAVTVASSNDALGEQPNQQPPNQQEQTTEEGGKTGDEVEGQRVVITGPGQTTNQQPSPRVRSTPTVAKRACETAAYTFSPSPELSELGRQPDDIDRAVGQPAGTFESSFQRLLSAQDVDVTSHESGEPTFIGAATDRKEGALNLSRLQRLDDDRYLVFGEVGEKTDQNGCRAFQVPFTLAFPLQTDQWVSASSQGEVAEGVVLYGARVSWSVTRSSIPIDPFGGVFVSDRVHRVVAAGVGTTDSVGRFVVVGPSSIVLDWTRDGAGAALLGLGVSVLLLLRIWGPPVPVPVDVLLSLVKTRYGGGSQAPALSELDDTGPGPGEGPLDEPALETFKDEEGRLRMDDPELVGPQKPQSGSGEGKK